MGNMGTESEAPCPRILMPGVSGAHVSSGTDVRSQGTCMGRCLRGLQSLSWSCQKRSIAKRSQRWFRMEASKAEFLKEKKQC